MKKIIFLLLSTLLLAGCVTQTYMNASSAVLSQMQVSSPNDLLTGSYRKYYIFGFLPADYNNSLEMAVKNALSKNPQASTLVNVFVENKIIWYLFWATEDIVVTGTPVTISSSESVSEIMNGAKTADEFCPRMKDRKETQREAIWNLMNEKDKNVIINDVKAHGTVETDRYDRNVITKFTITNHWDACNKDLIQWILSKNVNK